MTVSVETPPTGIVGAILLVWTTETVAVMQRMCAVICKCVPHEEFCMYFD